MKVVLVVVGVLGACWSLGQGRELNAQESDGPRATYFADGKLASERSYRDGVLHGPALERYPDGKQAARGLYQDGRRAGTWSFWLADGSLDAERSGQYEGGQRVGPAQESADS